MNRERAKELLPLMQAFAEGKTIQQYNYLTEDWVDLESPVFTAMDIYRIKPEYYPFKTKEECLATVGAHAPFGWVEGIDGGYYFITIINEYGISINSCSGGHLNYSFDSAFKDLKFIDGTPFGMKEELREYK